MTAACVLFTLFYIFACFFSSAFALNYDYFPIKSSLYFYYWQCSSVPRMVDNFALAKICACCVSAEDGGHVGMMLANSGSVRTLGVCIGNDLNLVRRNCLTASLDEGFRSK